MGNAKQATDPRVLTQLGITHVLNCSDDVDCRFIESKTVRYARISMRDQPNSNIYDFFEAAAQFIDECNPMHNRSTGKSGKSKRDWRVLIHCKMGMSRSATIA